MINYDFDIVAICISLIVLVSEMVRGTFRNKSSRMYATIVVLALVASLMDFGQAYISTADNVKSYYIPLSFAMNTVFFIVHTLMMPLYGVYTLVDTGIWNLLKSRKAKFSIVWRIIAAICVATILINIWSHNMFYITADAQYVRGGSIVVLYVATAIYITYIWYFMIKYRELIPKDKLLCQSLMYPIIIASLIIQFFLPNLLVEMFATSIALMMFSIVIRRRDQMLDPITKAKKFNAGVNNMRMILKTQTHVEIILIKMNNHRNINMYLGQNRFNEFLRKQSDMLNRIAEKGGIAGDLYFLESGLFAYMVPQRKDDLVEKTADDIAAYYKSSVNCGDMDVDVDARICIVRCPEDISDYDTLITLGTSFHDTLPKSKDVIQFRDYADDISYQLHNDIGNIINSALENREFEVHYQPIYSMREKRFVSAEALLRLHTEKYGWISPAMIIEAAEVSGRIYEIGDYVLEEVCRFISSYDITSIGLDKIHVNMSASQCIEVNLVKKIFDIAKKYKIDVSNLNFEINESAADVNPEIVDQNVRLLADRGITFSLDNYGTGYSNIKRVTDMPFDLVKLDRDFVSDLSDSDMLIMITETISMLKKMGKQVLIEGVEDETMMKCFTEMGTDFIQGCDFLQGFYYCKPLPAVQFLSFMEGKKSQDSSIY